MLYDVLTKVVHEASYEKISTFHYRKYAIHALGATPLLFIIICDAGFKYETGLEFLKKS